MSRAVPSPALCRQLYRSILQHAVRFDRNPAYKALLSDNLHYDEPLSEPLRQFLGNRMHYLPNDSLLEFLRCARSAADTSGDFMGLGDTTDRNSAVSSSFALLRQLNMISFVGEQAGVVSSEANASTGGDGTTCMLPPLSSIEDLTPGTLLVAHPLYLDPAHTRRVVVVLANDTTNGSLMGVAINGKRSTITLDRLVAETTLGRGRRGSRRITSDVAAADSVDALRKAPVFCGGPDEGVVCLHRSDSSVCRGATHLFGGEEGSGTEPVYYGGDYMDLASSVASGANTLRCFNGLYHFQRDQLQDEIDDGIWLAVRGSSTDCAMRDDVRWSSTLRGLGGEFGDFAQLDKLSLDHFDDLRVDDELEADEFAITNDLF